MDEVLNFSAVSSRSLAGRGLRLILKALPTEMRVPILQGGLRGAWWIVGSATHGCWLGSYEKEKQELFRSRLSPGTVVYDVGANVGFYSLLASRSVGHNGRVFAFEPFPRNLAYLRRHLAMNRVNNVEVVGAAVASGVGSARFAEGQNPSTGRVDLSGAVQVPTVSLDAFVYEQGHPPPAVVKMDIEGGEAQALLGAHRVLGAARPLLFLATHGPGVHASCLDILATAGYTIESLDSRDVASSAELLARP